MPIYRELFTCRNKEYIGIFFIVNDSSPATCNNSVQQFVDVTKSNRVHKVISLPSEQVLEYR